MGKKEKEVKEVKKVKDYSKIDKQISVLEKAIAILKARKK
jgi:hypothetical protein